MERSEKAKKLREQRKFGKKVGVFIWCGSCHCFLKQCASASFKCASFWKRQILSRGYFDSITDTMFYYLCIKTVNFQFFLPGSNRSDPEETKGEKSYDVCCEEIPERLFVFSSFGKKTFLYLLMYCKPQCVFL